MYLSRIGFPSARLSFHLQRGCSTVFSFVPCHLSYMYSPVHSTTSFNTGADESHDIGGQLPWQILFSRHEIDLQCFQPSLSLLLHFILDLLGL